MDAVFGARPLQRFLQRNVETKLVRALIADEVGEGSDLTFTVENEQLALVQDSHAVKKCALGLMPPRAPRANSEVPRSTAGPRGLSSRR